MKKLLFFVLALTGAVLAAKTSNPFDKWAISGISIKQNPKMRQYGDGCTTLRGKDKGEWLIFKAADPVNATGNDKIQITFTASGKGSVKIGIYGYVSGFNYRGPRTVLYKAAAKKETKTITVSVPGGSKIVRPVVLVQAGSEVTFYSHSMKVLKGKGAAAKKTVTKAPAKKDPPNIFTGWGWGNSNVYKIPGSRVITGTSVKLKNVIKDQMFYRPANPLNATLNDKVEIKFTASGKGTAEIGFFGYIANWSFCGKSAKKFTAAEKKQTVTWVFNVPRRAKIVRPIIYMLPGSEITFYEYSIKVLPFANPQLDVKAEVDKASAVYAAGGKAVYNVRVVLGNKLVKEGKAVVNIRHDMISKKKMTIDLSKNNPFKVEVSMARPGFADVLCDVTGVKKQKIIKNMQLGGVGFSPEKIKLGAPVPKDLLTYWQGQYKKLCKEVPANFKLTKVKEDSRFTDYKLTADNFGGTKTYATLTIPKGKGPFPMFFNVPPAGLTVYGFYRRARTITLCISVHDTDIYTSQKIYRSEMSRKGWYFYRHNGTRESYFYYKSILGVMRMMDYAMKNVKEWDGRHLAAGGQSQGGGSAFIMAALNPKIRGIYADIPALCDHNGPSAGRTAGWPQLLSHPYKGKKLSPQDAAYFDAAAFAFFVKCPAVVSVGFIDTMCLPSSVYAAYNNLKGPKQIINCVKFGHGWGTRSRDFNNASNQLIRKALNH